MCKANKYMDNLIQLYEDVQSEVKELKTQQSLLDLKQQDLLHIIEGTSFNASDGYKLAKAIQDCRKQRRLIKNELDTMEVLSKSLPQQYIEDMRELQLDIQRRDDILSTLSEQAIYTPRTTTDGDGNVVITDGGARMSKHHRDGEKRAKQEMWKSQFVHNANIIKTGLKTCVVEEVSKDKVSCIVLDALGNYNNHIIAKKRLQYI